MTQLPRLLALLSFYDESPTWLAATITSLAPFCDHVIAVDGAYALYPYGEPQSRADQVEGLIEASQAAGLGITLHRPRNVWFGNEVEKRTRLFQLAELEAEPNIDWYFVVDADVVVDRHPVDLKYQLAGTDLDVAQVSVWERSDPYANESRLMHESKVALPPDYHYPIRCLFRAVPGLHVADRHYYYVTGDNRILWGHPLDPRQQEALDLTGLFRIEHRTYYRPKQRRDDAQAYYRRREEAGVEAEPQVVMEANERAKAA